MKFSLLALTALLGGAAAATVNLSWNIQGLEDLGPDAEYEAWVIADGAPVSGGRFTVDGNGEASLSNYSFEVADGADVAAYVLTVEPQPDDDPGPSHVHLVGGDFDDNGNAVLTTGHGAALANNFGDIGGSFVLGAPSAGTDGEYRNGIWWLVENDDGTLSPGLNLPALPEQGWVYEGWVVGPNGPISTGRFTAVDAADDNAAGPGGGDQGSPSFPGEDFVFPEPRDLTTGYAAVISIEPEPDNAPGPFVLKPLIDTNIDDIPDLASQRMDSHVVASFPVGGASYRIAGEDGGDSPVTPGGDSDASGTVINFNFRGLLAQ